MKIDTHVLFLILIVGIISAGLVGANVLNSDQSMKQEVFDGIKISVPSDSNFVKTGDGVYKDSKYGISINTFKNNDSMIKFLKNTKNSKVVPIENQPPQSVAFKKGDTINILVTNGQEGVAVSSKDGELTAKIANNVIFSDNHKTQKPTVLNIINPPMEVHKDFNLIMACMENVDNKIFNVAVFENNIIPLIVDNYNVNIAENNNILDSVPIFDSGSDSDSDSGSVDVSPSEDNSNSAKVITNDTSNSSADSDDAIIPDPADTNSSPEKELTATLDDISKTNEPDSSSNSPSSSASPSSASSSSSQAVASPASSSSPSSSASPASSPSSSPSNSPSSSSSSNAAKYTYADCKKLVMDSLPSTLSIKELPGEPEKSGNDFIFHITDSTNQDMGIIRVDSTTGKIDDTGLRN